MPPLTDPVVRIHEFDATLDVRGAKIVDGFPSVGLVSTIAANFLIDSLKLRQIGVMDSEHFPTLSVVHHGQPLSPVRIYGGDIGGGKNGEAQRVVIFVSEFQPAPQLVRPIAHAILEWGKAKGCDYVISPEGLVLEGEDDDVDEVEVYGIGSTSRANELLAEHKVDAFQEGIITGVSGVLLNLGNRLGADVVNILAEAHPNYPDARSAARVIQVIAKLLGLKMSVDPLLREAEGFEAQIKALQRQANQKQRRTETSPGMYG